MIFASLPNSDMGLKIFARKGDEEEGGGGGGFKAKWRVLSRNRGELPFYIEVFLKTAHDEA